VVSDDADDAKGTPRPAPQQVMARHGSAGGTLLAGEVASRRVLFIWRHGAREGISKDAFKRRWDDSKNGCPMRHDAHFDDFTDGTHATVERSPSTIRPGLLAKHLTDLAAKDIHHDVSRDVSTSISMACVEAPDQAFQPGESCTAPCVFEGERRNKPTRRVGAWEHSDVALLCSEM
jgi:hypothetical protein